MLGMIQCIIGILSNIIRMTGIMLGIIGIIFIIVCKLGVVGKLSIIYV